MHKAEEYELHARECQALARKAVTLEERSQLLAMAETWLGLAAQRTLIGRSYEAYAPPNGDAHKSDAT